MAVFDNKTGYSEMGKKQCWRHQQSSRLFFLPQAVSHRSFYLPINSEVSGDKIEKNEMSGTCSAYGGEEEAYTGFWWGNLRQRDYLGDPGVDGRIILRWIFRRWDVGVWTVLSWLRLGTDGGHL